MYKFLFLMIALIFFGGCKPRGATELSGRPEDREDLLDHWVMNSKPACISQLSQAHEFGDMSERVLMHPQGAKIANASQTGNQLLVQYDTGMVRLFDLGNSAAPLPPAATGNLKSCHGMTDANALLVNATGSAAAFRSTSQIVTMIRSEDTLLCGEQTVALSTPGSTFALSPDGEHLAFTSKRKFVTGIYIAPILKLSAKIHRQDESLKINFSINKPVQEVHSLSWVDNDYLIASVTLTPMSGTAQAHGDHRILLIARSETPGNDVRKSKWRSRKVEDMVYDHPQIVEVSSPYREVSGMNEIFSVNDSHISLFRKSVTHSVRLRSTTRNFDTYEYLRTGLQLSESQVRIEAPAPRLLSVGIGFGDQYRNPAAGLIGALNPKLIAASHIARDTCEGMSVDPHSRPALHLYYHQDSPDFDQILLSRSLILDDLPDMNGVLWLRLESSEATATQPRLTWLESTGRLRTWNVRNPIDAGIARYKNSDIGKAMINATAVDPLHKSRSDVATFLTRFKDIELQFEHIKAPIWDPKFFGSSKSEATLIAVAAAYSTTAQGVPKDLRILYQGSIAEHSSLVPPNTTIEKPSLSGSGGPGGAEPLFKPILIRGSDIETISSDFNFNQSDFGVGLFLFRIDLLKSTHDINPHPKNESVVQQALSTLKPLCWQPIFSKSAPDIPAKIICTMRGFVTHGELVYDVTRVSGTERSQDHKTNSLPSEK